MSLKRIRNARINNTCNANIAAWFQAAIIYPRENSKVVTVMHQLKPLSDFFIAIAHDPRIGVSHISVYCALLQHMFVSDVSNPVLIQRTELMKMAKISGLGTYHKCIRDLHDFGYIQYNPCYNHRKKSRIYLLAKEN